MTVETNIKALLSEIDWLEMVIHHVISRYLEHEGDWCHWTDLDMPVVDDSVYHHWCEKNKVNQYQRLALALALAPQIKPEVLDIFFGKNQIYDRGFTEFGGIIDANHSGFLPTGQTLMFLATAIEPTLRNEVKSLFRRDGLFSTEQILSIESTSSYIPDLNGVLVLNKRWLRYFQTGKMVDIEQSIEFPAKRIGTQLEWEDVVLNDQVMDQIMELKTWLLYGETLMSEWGLRKKIKPGYRTLFYGPPGTGKTLTVTLLGKVTNREVYRVDLSMIVSKYIGETEKNLSKIFDIAQYKNWILFFDEADALFGKRTEANSSNDRHANQQTSYLLQRIEDFPGVIILASNLKTNMDAAFTRRFQSMIHFPMPDVNERYQLWKNAFSGTCVLQDDVDLWKIAENYELAGGAIINVLRFCALAAIQRNDTVVKYHELIEGIRKEFKKENRTIVSYQ